VVEATLRELDASVQRRLRAQRVAEVKDALRELMDLR
jgi:hypothetical protein